MGTNSSHDTAVDLEPLNEREASDDDEEAQQRRGRAESREESSESEASEREIEDDEEEEEERRRESNVSYYGDLLFGGNRYGDILAGPRFERSISRPPRVHETRSVLCDVNLAKETLRLLPIANEDGAQPTTNLYQVRFNFDANVECRIRLFFAAQEKRDEQNHLIG